MEIRYDCVIVGAGPGGLQAAIHLGRYHRRALLLDHGGGRTRHALHIENYLGIPAISGKELVEIGIGQLKAFGGEFRREKVERVAVAAEGFAVVTGQGRYRAPFVIASTGVTEKIPPIAGMNRFFGRSVFTCVDCDGYRTLGKRLVILGDSLEGVRLALGMKQMFAPRITLALPEGLLPADLGELLDEEGIAAVAGLPQEFLGDQLLAGVRLHTGETIPCEAAMLSYGYQLNDGYLAGLDIARDGKRAEIVTSSVHETSLRNLFAVGALTPGNPQAVIAAGQGCQAAIEINRRLLEI
ncbi:MAG: NAD(P)/FAD-dependent oxidoreductase [Thermodesulfobacteriota bacterium]